jgi:hypothetical protein
MIEEIVVKGYSKLGIQKSRLISAKNNKKLSVSARWVRRLYLAL